MGGAVSRHVKRAAPIGGTAKTTPHDFLYVETFSEAIRSDPAWRGGWYSSGEEVHLGPRRHARVWGLMGFSTEFYKQEVWRGLGFTSLEDFLVGLLEGAFLPNDSNNLLCQAWKWQQGDVGRHSDGDLAAALGRVKAKTLVLPVDEDMVIPTRDCEAEQRLIPGSELRVINSRWGHLALLGLDSSYTEQVDRHLGELLDDRVRHIDRRSLPMPAADPLTLSRLSQTTNSGLAGAGSCRPRTALICVGESPHEGVRPENTEVDRTGQRSECYRRHLE